MVKKEKWKVNEMSSNKTSTKIIMEKKLITVETFVSEIRDKQNMYEGMV